MNLTREAPGRYVLPEPGYAPGDPWHGRRCYRVTRFATADDRTAWEVALPAAEGAAQTSVVRTLPEARALVSGHLSARLDAVMTGQQLVERITTGDYPADVTGVVTVEHDHLDPLVWVEDWVRTGAWQENDDGSTYRWSTAPWPLIPAEEPMWRGAW